MKIIGLILIALTTGATNIVYASSNNSNSCAAIVIETNSGQIAYFAQIETNKSQVQLDAAVSAFKLFFLEGEKITDSKGKTTLLEYDVVAKDGTVTLTIVFDSYQSFYDYNRIDLTSAQNRKIEIKESLFFYERTITLSDPYARFFNTATNKAAKILDEFNTEFNTDNKETDYGYIFASSFRRTDVNCDEKNTDFAEGIWEYYFNLDPLESREIVIFDRLANTPIWYGIAAAATLVFMCGLYFILKLKQKAKSKSA